MVNRELMSYNLSDKEYYHLTSIIYEEAGIFLGDNKMELVHARLSKLIRKRGIPGFKEYIEILKNDRSGDELVDLLDAISTNVTHFFREEAHFDFITEMITDRTYTGGLRFWSAGCSSGEEPYTIAISVLETGVGKPFILATDLSTKVLDKAKKALYNINAVDKLDKMILRKYFLKGKNNNEGLVKVKKEITELVTFKRLNLTEPFSFKPAFDFILCRNVMIYFDNTIREKIVSKYYDSLNPGGYLIIGHSESLNGISHRFQYVRPTIYRKII